MMGPGFMYGMGGSGWIGSLLFLALLAVGIVYLVRELDRGRGRRERAGGPSAVDPGSVTRPDADPRGDDPALRILRERYARSEIDREEFEQRKRDLA